MELRREGIYQPPLGRRPTPATQPAPAPPAPPPEATPFGSLSVPLPEFNHRKTEVEPWLDLVDTPMTLANVCPEARVTAATHALDEVARRAVYGAKKQAQGPFGWPEFCTALKDAFMVKKSDLDLRGRLESLPVKLQQADVTGGMTNWTTYKEMKEQVIKTDNIIRTYVYGPDKPGQQPRAEGSGGHGNRPQNAKGGSGWNKRPFHQRGHQTEPQAKRAGGGGGRCPNNPDFSDKQSNGCGRMGHIERQCRGKNPIKYSGKPKPGGAGPSGKKEFQKPN
ncbi:unnamed protein product [Closterium sp. Naga37s-1]|nr:unnamed protein product [Closterium sp. Naga37s-1]